MVLNKAKKFDGIGKLISLLDSKDTTVARGAAYALSNAAPFGNRQE